MFRAVNLMLSAVLAVWFTDLHRQVCLKQPDVHTPVRDSVPVDNLDHHVLKDEVHGDDGPEGGAGLHHVNNLWDMTVVPKPMEMPKWFDDEAELKEGDVFYFGKFESEYSSKWNVRKVSDVVKDQLSNTDRAARSVHEFEEYEQDVPDTLPLVENKLMLLFCAVNTDFTGLETEPDASVDSSF